MDAKQLEEVSGHEHRARRAAVDAGFNAAPYGRYVNKHAGLAPERLVIRARERHPRIRAWTCRPDHRKQLVGVLDRIDTKEKQAVEREHRRHQPEADGDRGNDGESGEGGAAEGAERVEAVARQIVDEASASLVATLVGGKRHRAEAGDRPGASVYRAQARRDVLLRVALDMERELLVEFAFDAMRSHHRVKP